MAGILPRAPLFAVTLEYARKENPMNARPSTLRSACRRTATVIVSAGLLGALAACGGGGVYGGGGNTPVTGVGASKLFVADSQHAAVGSLANPNPLAGTLTVDRVIGGPSSIYLTTNIGSLALDTANDILYVGNGAAIKVFNSASMANGDPPQNRTILNSPPGGNAGSMALDTTNNRLYVGDDVFGVRVFNNATTINNTTASNRVITSLGTIHGVAVDAGNDILYVSNTTSAPSNEINLFTASTANDPATPIATITPTVSTTNLPVGGISLDAARDLLYVAGFSDSTVNVFGGVHSTTGGAIAPTKTLTFPATISSVTIDSTNNRLYAVSLGAIYILNSASTATDPITVTAILVPAGGGFTAVAVNPN
jgi:hypothetical protein